MSRRNVLEWVRDRTVDQITQREEPEERMGHENLAIEIPDTVQNVIKITTTRSYLTLACRYWRVEIDVNLQANAPEP